MQRLSDVPAVRSTSEKLLIFMISTYCMKTSLPLAALRETLVSYHNLAEKKPSLRQKMGARFLGAKEDVVITFGGIPDVSLIWMRHQLCRHPFESFHLARAEIGRTQGTTAMVSGQTFEMPSSPIVNLLMVRHDSALG